MHDDVHVFGQAFYLLEVDVARGGASLSLPASPPITTLPAGVSTR